MVTVIINWIYIAVTTYIVGNAGMRLFYRLFFKGDKACRRTPFYDLFAGIMCTTCYAQIYSLFGGVGRMANLLLLAFCLIYIIFFGKRMWEELNPSLSIRLLWCLPLLLLFALASSGAPKLIDTDWYHAQTIRWIEEYGCVTGVANLFYSLGFNSAQHYFDALYSMKDLFGQSMHATEGYFGCLILLHGLCRLVGVKKHKRHIADALAVTEVIYSIIETAFFADPYTDMLPNCLVFFILTEWFILLEDEEEEPFPYAFLCVLGVFATVVKTSVAMIILLVIRPAIRLMKRKAWKEIVGYLLTGILVAVPFFITNVKTSGYLVYLASFADWFEVPWKIDVEILKYSVDSMVHAARAVDMPMEEALHGGLSWVNVWFKNESVSHKILYLAIFGLLLLDLAGLIGRVLRKEKIELPMLLPRVIVFIGLVYWFFTIPQVKYCWAFLLFPLAVIPGIYLEKAKGWKRKIVYLAAAGAGVVLLLFGGFYTLRTLGYVAEAVPKDLLKQADYAKYEMKPVVKDGLTFYVREEGGAVACGYYVFPYLNDEELLNRLVVGDELKDGFSLQNK